MAEAAVTVALETITGMLIEQAQFLFGVRDEVGELQVELEALQSYLRDATARKHEQARVRTWMREAKGLACRAEDIIEEYAIKVATRRGGGFKKVARRVACIVGESIATHQVGNEIGKLKTKIVNLKNNLESYGINRIIEAQPSSATIEKERRLRTTYAHEVDEYFVGMEDDVSKIVTWVTEDDMTRCVITICGSGGSGKTTIARKVFNHIKESSERSFECFAWVSVTQECQVKMLLKDILNQLGDKVGASEETELFRKLNDVMKNKKCFVVLDDIWKLGDWKSLSKALSVSEGSSKILLTTRIKEVAEVAQQDSRHEPKLLNEKDGWDLLTKIALNLQEDQGNTLSESMTTVGKDMLQKCGGLPLAISALGGILSNKDTLAEWETVNETFRTYVGRDDRVASVLALSYDDLPSYLRPCFLYMGCFREDEEIDVMGLYKLWMAEGLTPTRQTGPKETLMDVASDFLHELISRNMVQTVVRSGELMDNKACRLHDLMRDLCLRKGIEEGFMEVKSIQIRNEEVASVCIGGVDLCRQTIMVDIEDEWKISIAKSTSQTCFRALILFDQGYSGTIEGAMKFKRLRSLILDGCKFKHNKLPKEIRDMIHLRYLSLEDSLEDGKLPTFIGELQYLQTLNLADNDQLELPNIFKKMKRLRYLYLPRNRVQKSAKRLEFHGLNELEVVEGLDSRSDKVSHLSESVNLGRLTAEIWGYEDLSTILGQLSSLLNLQYVSITFKTEESELEKGFPNVQKLLLCPSLCFLVLNAPIGKFPRYEDQFWPDLVRLVLRDTKLEEDPMPFLQELPNLRRLFMEDDAYVGKEMYCSSKAFPKLTFLLIKYIPNIEIWSVDAGAFPQLTSLDILDLPKMKKWRVDAGAFPNLQTLFLSETKLEEDPMPFLQELPNLRTLKLGSDAYVGKEMYCSSKAFPKLTYLRITSMPNIEIWRVDAGAFPQLTELEIIKMPKMKKWRVDAGAFPNLQTLFLKETKLEEDPMPFLQELPNLRKLSILFSTKDSGSELENGFPDVKKLLLCPSLHTLQLCAPIGKFPRYEHQFWPDLVSLTLGDTKLEEDPMPFLQELPNLRELWMYGDAYVGEEMYCSSKAFPKLTYLRIRYIPNIEIWRVDAGAFPQLTTLYILDLPKMKKWRVDAGAFPNLQTLVIRECVSFEEIVPDGLTSITTLTSIDIYDMPEEFRNRYGRVQKLITRYSATEL